jgi:hypothetical protein
VYRQYDAHGLICRDMLCCVDELYEGHALLRQVMIDGQCMSKPHPISEIRHYCAEQLATLPVPARTLEPGSYSPAKVSDRQHALAAEVDRAAR